MRPALRPVLLLALLASPAVAAERLVGRARVIDGDTIVVGGVHVRLQGVAAPEVEHPGFPHDKPSGPEARASMQALVEGRAGPRLFLLLAWPLRRAQARGGVSRRADHAAGAVAGRRVLGYFMCLKCFLKHHLCL